MKSKNILITGGAGFIGSHVVRLFVKNYPEYNIYNLDSLTYAGNLKNLVDVENKKNYTFLHGDINNENFVKKIFKKYNFDNVIHLAAESHVDRSIFDPLIFAKTNILGTICLLNNFLNLWWDNWDGKRFYHISTDEVYGALGEKGLFKETSPYKPNSPYSASKASSDHFVRAFGKTYDMPYVISNSSNNYGENQFPEKLIPLFINNILIGKSLPVFGDGNYVRDWLYVKDHADAIDLVFHSGKNSETYNIGGSNELKNIDLVKLICSIIDEKLSRNIGTSEKLITYVRDRLGHDFRYSVDSSKIKNELGWKPKVPIEKGLSITIDWYMNNKNWINNINPLNYEKFKIN